jgi:mono/diheme cytochrome c family protein
VTLNYKRRLSVMMILATLGASAAFAADAAPGAAEIYKTKCASCHGADGGSQTPAGKVMKAPDLRSAEVQKRSGADLQQAISNGKGKMPPFKAKLSVADVASLVAYIRGLAKK